MMERPVPPHARKQTDAHCAWRAWRASRTLRCAAGWVVMLMLAAVALPATAEPRDMATSDPSAPDGQRAFSTRHAHFAPAAWRELPGWHDDDLSDAWRAFLQSCTALGRRPVWEAPCARARGVGQGNDTLRAFFEREFVLYEILNADRTPDGVITGYYEPLLAGSRTRQGAFVHPVYGQPADLLTLDVRLWPKPLRGQPVAARLEGRLVIPVPNGTAPYVIEADGLAPDARDKKLRLRLDGHRLVPYFSRAEIERDGLARAPVLAWVDNAAALYSMQIQGSGKIRLPEGGTLRLAFAEQNGRPFRPSGVSGAGNTNKHRITTRGLSIDLPDDEDDASQGAADPREVAEPLTRGRRGSAPAAVSDADVERMIELLAGGGEGSGQGSGQGGRPIGKPAAAGVPATPIPPIPPTMAHRESPPSATIRPGRAESTPAEPMIFARPSVQALAAISADPSYVFFREIPDGPGGPIGALGVPLTAGRSVAVDPRTTPLGFPVFLATSRPGDKSQFNRLMMAQDTGGAIRGAVRADYFWGFGADAYAQAARMKESGRMWLLMPTGQQVAARDQALLTRGSTDPAAMPDCVVADPELCVEDR